MFLTYQYLLSSNYCRPHTHNDHLMFSGCFLDIGLYCIRSIQLDNQFSAHLVCFMHRRSSCISVLHCIQGCRTKACNELHFTTFTAILAHGRATLASICQVHITPRWKVPLSPGKLSEYLFSERVTVVYPYVATAVTFSMGFKLSAVVIACSINGCL